MSFRDGVTDLVFGAGFFPLLAVLLMRKLLKDETQLFLFLFCFKRRTTFYQIFVKIAFKYIGFT